MAKRPLRSKADPYRCDDCRARVNRCDDCRAARAAKRRLLRARKVDDGECIDCPRPAARLPSGDIARRCKVHLRDVAVRSGASHKAAREA